MAGQSTSSPTKRTTASSSTSDPSTARGASIPTPSSSRRVAREMVRQGGGKIVNTSTLYTNIVGPLPESAYYASKAGVANLTRGLALEWGKQGINVNCLAPGVFYPTNMTAPLAKQPERLEWMRSRTLLGRLGNPEHDLKGVVVFLASPAADYVTGQVIFADGGWTAW